MQTLDNPVIGKAMFKKGYRYLLVFHEDSELTSLYVKSIPQAAQVLREDFPTEMCRGGYVITRIDKDGELVC